MKTSRREAIAALAGWPALAAFLEACRGSRVPAEWDGTDAGGDAALGHKLRSGELLARPPARTEKIGVAILGAGVSGLSAAWTLAGAGRTDFRVYELEGEPGGTARAGRNEISAYPWGAHYVPVPLSPNPDLEALLEAAGGLERRDAEGKPVWSEAALVREPEERLFFRGRWWDGLYPRAGARDEDLAELKRFEAALTRFAESRDAAGRRAFALPRRLSSGAFADLDRLSMADWLDREGFRTPRLRWFAEYGTRDDFGSALRDVSAWAGIHYYAARLSPDGSQPFLTWPEGNGRLVATLRRACAGRLATRHLVFDAVPRERGVSVRVLDAARDEVVAVEAEHAVFALPKLVASRVVAPYRAAPPAFLSAFVYVPWLVANVTLKDRPVERGAPMAWDNVLHDSPSLGYVVATHQAWRDHGPTVLTWYRPFAGEPPDPARRALFSASRADLAAAAVADLATAHPDLPTLVSRVDVYRWGHAMARPSPGLFTGGALEAAARPIGRLRFAHADLSGLPLFEEALDAGVRAARGILEAS